MKQLGTDSSSILSVTFSHTVSIAPSGTFAVCLPLIMFVVSGPPPGLMGHRLKIPNLPAVDEAVRLFIGSHSPCVLQHALSLALSPSLCLSFSPCAHSNWLCSGD